MPENQIQVKLNPDVQPSGSDLAVVNAARRSFNTRSDWVWSCVRGCSGPNIPCTVECHRVNKEKGNFKLKEKDKRLIQFLARGMTADDFDEFVGKISIYGYNIEKLPDHEWEIEKELLIEKLWQWRNTPTHDTPFNHCFISFEVKAPVFVARQLVKHEYLIMSEFSRRYITDDIEFYTPDTWRKAAENKKQGSSNEAANLGDVGYYVNEELEEVSLRLFKTLLDKNVAPEQVRMVLPQSTMTEWTWSGTLGAFAKMCQLRIHPEAQYEARLVARQVYDYLLQFYPVSAKALVEGADV